MLRARVWRSLLNINDGIPCLKVVGISEGDVTCLSPLTLEPLNADFDGDTVAIYRIHDQKALKELEKNAFMMNNISYDHNGDFIQRIRLENLYPAYLLLNSTPNTEMSITCPSLEKLPTSFETTLNFNRPVLINGRSFAYGLCLFNKWCGFKTVKITGFMKADQISKEIYKDSNSNSEYHDRLNDLNKKLLWYVSTHPTESITLSLDEIAELNMGVHKNLMSKLPYNPYIGQHIYEAITHRIYDDIPEKHQLKKLTKIKIQRTQLSRMIGAIGYIADDQNIVNSQPLTESIFGGLDKDMFFLTAMGTRKGIVDKSKATPNSGYLERSMVINLSPVEIDMEDCGTSIRFQIKILSVSHVKSLIGRWHHDYDKSKDVVYNPKNINTEVGKTYYFRSPITCGNPDFKICRKCFGKYHIPTPNVGILAGQYIAERMTQLSMRTFHTSGSCTLPTNKEVVDIIYKNLEDLNSKRMLFLDDEGSTIILNRILTEQEVRIFANIEGYKGVHTDDGRTYIMYSNKYRVVNKDVTQVIQTVNQLLRRQDTKDLINISEVYHEYIDNVLDVGQIYSSFVEIVLCNMYLTKDNKIIRYALQTNPNAIAHHKLSIKKLHTVVSKLLGLLYEPNEVSIGNYLTTTTLPQQSETILEKVWNNDIT